MDKRVKYYSNSDMSIGFYLDRLKSVVNSLGSSSVISDVNDALELVNITKFIENGIFSTKWHSDYTDELKAKVPIMKGLTGKFFAGLSSADIGKMITSLDRNYYDDFIASFHIYKLGDKVSENEFNTLFEESTIPLWEILESKYLVEKYPDTIKKLFLAKPRNFETFLSNYTYSNSKKNLSIPKNISKSEMLKLCNEYVDSDEANSNYLDILMKPIKGTEKYIDIDTATKLKIKKRTAELQDKLFGDLSKGGLKVSIAILSSKEAYESELEKSTATDLVALVDSSWLEKHPDYPTLLNNFQHLYEFFSDDLISTLPSFPNREMGLEKVMGVRTENSYMIGQYFWLKHQLAVGKMRMIYELLSKKKIRIEDVIDWFFSTYSKQEFDVEWLPLDMPNIGESIGNKTATLFRIEENIRTQYYVLTNNGSIDSEIVNMTNTPSLRDLPSTIGNKYGYLSDDDIAQSIAVLLYSDQSSLTYIDDERQSHSFVSLISEHRLKASDFHDHQKPRIDYLIKHGAVVIRNDDTLGYSDIHEMYIYKKLFADGVIGYHHSPDEVKKALDKLQKENRVTLQSSLFSTQESEYLDFVLNSSRFDNSWAIRNAYQHGTPVYSSEDHYLFDYNMALLVLINHVIKINDELTLRKISKGEEPAYVEFV